VLSVYLDVDPSKGGNPNRNIEAQLRDLATPLRESLAHAADRDRFTMALHRVTDFVSTHQAAGRGLVIFVDESDGFFWHQDLPCPLFNQIRWGLEPFLRPLAAALDDLEDYGVVLVDRTKVRLLLVQLGKASQLHFQEAEDRRVRHVKSTGSDKAESSSRMQRKADNQVRANLKEFIRATEQFVKTNRLRRLVLAGTPQIIAEFREMLPARLALLVTGEATLAMHASLEQVTAAAQPVADAFERSTEETRVREVLTAAAKTSKAVAGIGPTLEAVSSGRVWELIYSASPQTPGFECRKCSALFLEQNADCVHCGGSVQPVADVVEPAIERAIRKQAKIEVVTGTAASALTSGGGIAAFLKTRARALAAG
jgi:peptide subunit release factor 1 (eRF1)